MTKQELNLLQFAGLKYVVLGNREDFEQTIRFQLRITLGKQKEKLRRLR
jgi:hypothetical protein